MQDKDDPRHVHGVVNTWRGTVLDSEERTAWFGGLVLGGRFLQHVTDEPLHEHLELY